MIRAVLDTNILLAALRSRQGASFELLRRYQKGEFSLVIANTVLTEYEEALKREGHKLGFSLSNLERFLDAICARAGLFGYSQPSPFSK